MSGAQKLYLDVISGRRTGMAWAAARTGLLLLSLPYMLIVALRNAWYDFMRTAVRKVPAPVFAVGNVTVGGTGKTPAAAAIADLLTQRGRKTAILLRGYKARTIQDDDASAATAPARGRVASDEAMVLKRLCPKATVLADPDRVAAARRAVTAGCDALVLDDAFQHRRIGRDLNVCLIDARLPFGFGHLLPRGLLREPVRAIRRADVLVLTRSDEIEESDKSLLLATLRRVSRDTPVVEATHRVTGFVDLKGRPVPDADATAMRAVVFAGIANFDSFRRGVESLGAQILAAYQYPDHHDYAAGELEALSDVAVRLDANVVLTTEKDAVKLVGRWRDEPCRLLAPRVAIEFRDDGLRVLSGMIDAVLGHR